MREAAPKMDRPRCSVLSRYGCSLPRTDRRRFQRPRMIRLTMMCNKMAQRDFLGARASDGTPTGRGSCRG